MLQQSLRQYLCVSLMRLLAIQLFTQRYFPRLVTVSGNSPSSERVTNMLPRPSARKW